MTDRPPSDLGRWCSAPCPVCRRQLDRIVAVYGALRVLEARRRAGIAADGENHALAAFDGGGD